jgi:hypothetical protein
MIQREPAGVAGPLSGRFAATSPPLWRGARNLVLQSRHPAMASGTALLLGIWMSISSVDMVSPRSIETCR